MGGTNLKRFDFSDFEPAFDDANDEDFDEALAVRERPQSGNRNYARELLDHWLNQESKINHWPNLNKKRIARGMHARIMNPDLIRQGPTGLCGPAGFMRALAREDPCEFALFGGLLYSRGFANLGRHGKIFKKVTPSAVTRRSRVPPDMHHTDWLILASLRDAYNDFFSYRWDYMNQMTGMSVSSVAGFFRGAGYSQVIENLGGSAIFKGSVNKGVDNIEKANRYLERGFQVLILIDSQILDTPRPGASPWANHWVALCSPIEVNRFWKDWSKNETSRIGVRIPEIWTWGEQRRRCIPPYLEYVSFEDFTNCYYGFVAAKAEL